MTLRVGFAGIGRMGDAMVRRLLDHDVPVTVWNRTPEKAEQLVAAGARRVLSPRHLGAVSDVILTMLTDDVAVNEVLTGPDGVLQGQVHGRVVADMSTVLPATSERLASATAVCGGAFIDAPVAGTVAPARQGKLLILAGGDAQAITRAQPVFDILARRTHHVGPHGSGSAMKLVHNTLLCAYWAALAEAMALGSRHGLSVRGMLDVIVESPAAFAALPVKLPLLLGETVDVGFDIDNVMKDLGTIRRFASEMGVDLPVSDAALSSYQEAAAAGFGKHDVGTIVRFRREPFKPE